MHTNKVFVRTAKAEREGMKLSNNLLRMLSLIDGKSTSGELAKRAPPSLRKIWNDLVVELVEGKYIVHNSEAVPDRKTTPRELNPIQKEQKTAPAPAEQTATVVQPTADPEARQKEEKAARAAELKAYFAAAKEKAKAELTKAQDELKKNIDARQEAKLVLMGLLN